jgi:hypothetical protein
VRVDKGAGYLMVCETVLRNYFFIFSLLLNSGSSFLKSLIARTTLCISIRRK